MQKCNRITYLKKKKRNLNHGFIGALMAAYTMLDSVLYKYNIHERVIVENIIPRNMIINRGAAEVDNHISRDDFFDYHPLKNVIFILLYRTLFLIFFYPFFL